MDLSNSIIAKSDQMDYSDFIAGPRVAAITEVRPGPTTEQPVEIILAEFDRPWRPSKSMRRVLVAAWGADSNNYIGRRMTLFGDPSVKWGGIAIGGIRISHVSHITKTLTVALTESKGKRKPFSVQPLADVAPVDYSKKPVPDGNPPIPDYMKQPKRDFLAEFMDIGPDPDRLRELWVDARNGGESKIVLDAIEKAATTKVMPDVAPAA